jgi:hypothetical protein
VDDDGTGIGQDALTLLSFLLATWFVSASTFDGARFILETATGIHNGFLPFALAAQSHVIETFGAPPRREID